MTEPVELSVETTEAGSVVLWNEAPGIESFDVIRGQLSSIVETDAVISLGPVTCIEEDSIDETTAGREDSALPEPGQAFFYLVEYDDGNAESSYGSASAAKPRTIGQGDCQ